MFDSRDRSTIIPETVTFQEPALYSCCLSGARFSKALKWFWSRKGICKHSAQLFFKHVDKITENKRGSLLLRNDIDMNL